jgi:hypothetical protein
MVLSLKFSSPNIGEQEAVVSAVAELGSFAGLSLLRLQATIWFCRCEQAPLKTLQDHEARRPLG